MNRIYSWLRIHKIQMGLWSAVVIFGTMGYLLGNYLPNRLISAVGVITFLLICLAVSQDPRKVRLQTVGLGLLLQMGMALLIFKLDWGQRIFGWLGDVIYKFLDFTNQGSEFVFGVLADPKQMDQVFGIGRGFVFAFRALPTIVFVAAFFAVLYHFGILQWVIQILARGMMKLMRVSGAESLCAAANIFMGQTEAPLMIKPYIKDLTASELMAMMIGGFATISVGVMAVYVDLGVSAQALLAGSVMSAPGCLVICKILWPETENPKTASRAEAVMARKQNVFDALSQGASDGMKLAINVAAMLIAFLAMIAMIDFLLGQIGLSLSKLFGWIFAPIAYLTGVPGREAPMVGDLLGTKLVANEFVAYLRLTGDYIKPGLLTTRTAIIAAVALCGFANFGSLGIQIGGIGGLVPERRKDMARLGLRALLGGFLVTLINAAMIGMIL